MKHLKIYTTLLLCFALTNCSSDDDAKDGDLWDVKVIQPDENPIPRYQLVVRDSNGQKGFELYSVTGKYLLFTGSLKVGEEDDQGCAPISGEFEDMRDEDNKFDEDELSNYKIIVYPQADGLVEWKFEFPVFPIRVSGEATKRGKK